jgi:hypothetical protein
VTARLRSTHRAMPACPPSYADYILRLLDTKPESCERHQTREPRDHMLRLLIVALPLVVALPAAFDEQEANAIQFEVQSPLQFEVRSPPESRPLLPAAPQEINTTAPPLHSARTTPTRTHHHARAAALEHGQDGPPRDQLRHQPLRAKGHQPFARRCVPRPGRQQRMQRAQLSVGPAAARGRARPAHML